MYDPHPGYYEVLGDTGSGNYTQSGHYAIIE